MTLSTTTLLGLLKQQKYEFFSGVPCSNFADLFELAELLCVRQLLLRGAVVRKVFARVGFARVDDEELKICRLIFAIESGQRGNLPHKRRSGDAAELEQHVFFAGK